MKTHHLADRISKTHYSQIGPGSETHQIRHVPGLRNLSETRWSRLRTKQGIGQKGESK